MKLKNNKKGFTLVELVIVIAVIAILAAVLIPTFGGVINNARESAAKQEASSLKTGILVEYAEKGGFEDYCVEYANEDGATYTLADPIVAGGEATFGDYISGEDIEITITADSITYTTATGYDVVITANDITVTK